MCVGARAIRHRYICVGELVRACLSVHGGGGEVGGGGVGEGGGGGGGVGEGGGC